MARIIASFREVFMKQQIKLLFSRYLRSVSAWYNILACCCILLPCLCAYFVLCGCVCTTFIIWLFFLQKTTDDAQLQVNFEKLQDGLIRATVLLTKPVPAEFPYSIHFVIVNPNGEEGIATENGSTDTVSQSFILDGNGRLDREEKTFIRTTLYFEIGGQLVKGPQDTRKIGEKMTSSNY